MGETRLHHHTLFIPALALLTAGICAGPAAPAVEAAALGSPYDDFTDMGVLRLQLGQTNIDVPSDADHLPLPSPRIVYETQRPIPTGVRDPFSQHEVQLFQLSGKCGGALAAAPQLATMGGSGPLGFGPDSVGIYDGPKGVACYRISAGASESLTFGIGQYANRTLGAWSFYRLELDIEVKQNARFVLQVLRGGVAVPGSRWILESGSSVTMPGNTAAGSNPFTCTARSDSAPDSGASDNCKWVINLDMSTLGDGFRLTAEIGEGSLEGGGDWGSAAYANNSIIYLTDVRTGVFGCETDPSLAGSVGSAYTGTIGDGMNSAQCSATQIDPSLLSSQECRWGVPYVFRTVATGFGGCELSKDENDDLVAVLDVVFPPEPRTELDAIPQTQITFPGAAPWTMPLCKGTLDLDANNDGLRIDRDPRPDADPDNLGLILGIDQVSPDPTIVEVFDYPADGIGVEDVVPGGALEWACVLESDVDYVGSDQMQVRQRVLFWGDPIVIRQREQ